MYCHVHRSQYNCTVNCHCKKVTVPTATVQCTVAVYNGHCTMYSGLSRTKVIAQLYSVLSPYKGHCTTVHVYCRRIMVTGTTVYSVQVYGECTGPHPSSTVYTIHHCLPLHSSCCLLRLLSNYTDKVLPDHFCQASCQRWAF